MAEPGVHEKGSKYRVSSYGCHDNRASDNHISKKIKFQDNRSSLLIIVKSKIVVDVRIAPWRQS